MNAADVIQQLNERLADMTEDDVIESAWLATTDHIGLDPEVAALVRESFRAGWVRATARTHSDLLAVTRRLAAGLTP